MGMKAEDVLGFTIGYVEKTLQGAGGLKGDKGEKGDPGTTYTPVIGTVRTVDSLTEASASVVTNDVTKKATFNFNIPKGADGAKGDKGETGEKGDRGDQGPQGIQGEKGEQGPAGVQGIQGIQGVKGEKGEDGYPFLIYKQYEVGIEEFDEADYPEIGLMFMVHVWEQDKGYPIYRYTGDGTATPYTLITYMNTEGIKGDKGDKGDQGEQGVPGVAGADGVDGTTYTPEIGSVNTVESSAGANVTLQVDHDQGRAIYNFDIPKGEDGTNGVDGQDGADGFSPIVTVTDIEGGHNVAIEDVNGVQNFEVLDGTRAYISLAELGLTADATFQDVADALPKGGSALLGVKEFTNYQTIFPCEEGNDQFARVYIVKGAADGSSMYARWFRKDGVKEAIAKFNINDNKFDGWEKVAIRTITTLAELGLTSSATVDDVHDKLAVGQLAILQVRAFDNYQTLFPYADSNDQYARIEILKGKSTTHSRIFWWRKDGSKFAVGNLNSNNKLAGWNEYTLRSYVDNKIADLQAQIDALKS